MGSRPYFLGLFFTLWLAPGPFAAQALGAAKRPQLSVLTPQRKLNFKVVREFEEAKQVDVRVEFVGSRAEFGARLRANPRGWDVVFGDERELTALALAKMVRPVPKDSGRVEGDKPLERASKLNKDLRFFVPIMVDPLGIVWKEQSVSGTQTPQWGWLNDPGKSPLWRSRTFLPPDPRFQLLIALKASGRPLPRADSEATMVKAELKVAMEWLNGARLQARADGTRPEVELLADRAVAGVMWKSDFLRAARLIPDLKFTIPAGGTYYERYGVSVVADTLVEALAADFVSYLSAKRDDLASYARLISVGNTVVPGAELKNWNLFEEDAQFLALASAHMQKGGKPE